MEAGERVLALFRAQGVFAEVPLSKMLTLYQFERCCPATGPDL